MRFVTIHPFDDGNGRIARAITDMLLARSEDSSKRFYSLSAQICAERKSYYEILEKIQKRTLDIKYREFVKQLSEQCLKLLNNKLWILERRWHKTQKIIRSHGGIMLSMTVKINDELARWVLSLGTHASVIKPDLLRAKVTQISEDIAKSYRK